MVSVLTMYCEKRFPNYTLTECAMELGMEPKRFREILTGAIPTTKELSKMVRTFKTSADRLLNAFTQQKKENNTKKLVMTKEKSLCLTCANATARHCNWIAESDRSRLIHIQELPPTQQYKHGRVYVLGCEDYENGPLPPIVISVISAIIA